MSTRGRRSETEPLEYHGEPLHRLDPAPWQPGQLVRMRDVIPGAESDPKPFLRGLLTIKGEFSGELYPGAAERLLEAMRNHPDYCPVCDGFPCRGGHPPEG